MKRTAWGEGDTDIHVHVPLRMKEVEVYSDKGTTVTLAAHAHRVLITPYNTSLDTYSTLQIQGIKRFACQTGLLQTQNAFKRCAKWVYYKRKTRR